MHPRRFHTTYQHKSETKQEHNQNVWRDAGLQNVPTKAMSCMTAMHIMHLICTGAWHREGPFFSTSRTKFGRSSLSCWLCRRQAVSTVKRTLALAWQVKLTRRTCRSGVHQVSARPSNILNLPTRKGLLARYQHHNLLNISQYSILRIIKTYIDLRIIFSEIQWDMEEHGETW